MSYQNERDAFISRMAAEGLPLAMTQRLLREATGLNRRAELACSSEAADRDRVKCPRAIAEKRFATKPLAEATKRFAQYPCLCDKYNGQHETIPRITLQDWQAEQRIKRTLPDGWTITTQGDPRGYVLRVIPPSYAERNADRDPHNLDSIGVPCGPSRLRF